MKTSSHYIAHKMEVNCKPDSMLYSLNVKSVPNLFDLAHTI